MRVSLPLRGSVVSMFVLAAVSAGPVHATDNPTPGPGDDNGPKPCALDHAPEGQGRTAPTNAVMYVPPGGVPLPGTTQSGTYLCINGQWILLVPNVGPGGVILPMQGAPTLSIDHESVVVDEGDEATNEGTVFWEGESPVVMSATIGTMIDRGDGSWTWSLLTSDGPAESQTVTVFAAADELVGVTFFELDVENVAPTVSVITADRTVALVGDPVTFTGAATDPSPVDTLAGFAWNFDGEAAVGNTATVAFDECGSYTVSGTAADKDGGTSDELLSSAVQIMTGSFAEPIARATVNVVSAGQVVPVRVVFGCGDQFAATLAPQIQLLAGDLDPATDADDPAHHVTTASASTADTSGVMRLSGHAYLYNLKVPKVPSGTVFTVRVRAGSGPSALYAVLRVR